MVQDDKLFNIQLFILPKILVKSPDQTDILQGLEEKELLEKRPWEINI